MLTKLWRDELKKKWDGLVHWASQFWQLQLLSLVTH